MRELEPRVLFVEDEEAVARQLALLMRGAVPSVRVETVGSLARAEKTVGGSAPDALVVDLALPDAQPRETLEWLRRTSIRPAAIVTGRTDAWLPKAAEQLGADFAVKGQGKTVSAVIKRSAFEALARKRGLGPRVARAFAEIAQECELKPAVSAVGLEILAEPDATRGDIAHQRERALGTIKMQIGTLLASVRVETIEAFKRHVHARAFPDPK